MAPALSLAPEPPDDASDSHEQLDKSQCNGRQVLAPVDNLAITESVDMGQQSQLNVKDTAMDQILVDLSGNDILQVMKTFENNNDALSTGDPESIFPLDLPETVDSESESPEDKIKLTQARIERRCAFLLRRLRILQARSIGKRVSEEVAQTFEKCTKGARKDGGGRPMGLKALLKRVETTAALQASAASKSTVGPKYYGASTSKCDASKTATVGISSGTLAGLEDTAGALRSHLSLVKKELDSDATASSSGAESNDEAVPYNNTHQQHMPIEKRALWSWQRERASIASRWSWLQAQVQELEYKIRQHNDLHKQVREAKGPVEFEGEPVGYEGSLPGSSTNTEDLETETCARVRPLRRETFKKRKLLQMHNLHVATSKAAKPSDIRCRCLYEIESCPVCTGRPDPTRGAVDAVGSAADDTLSQQQRYALMDPGYHPVLSDVKDVAPWMHLSILSSRPWFRPRAPRGAPPHSNTNTQTNTQTNTPHTTHTQHTPQKNHNKHNKKHHKMKRGRPPLSRKVKERERDEEHTGHERSRGRPSTDSRSWRRQSYDIDNIVIPQSIAANTRPQILTYKEIITPKWRVMEIPEVPLNNGISNSHRMSVDEELDEDEDVSDAAVSARHSRAESRERVRFPRARPARREQEHDTHEHVHNNSAEENSIRPYTPRQFPIPSPSYEEMLCAMPEGHVPSPLSPHSPPAPLPQSPRSPRSPHSPQSAESGSSTLSPLSAHQYEGDDPDDIEWEPTAEKSDRRKSTFR